MFLNSDKNQEHQLFVIDFLVKRLNLTSEKLDNLKLNLLSVNLKILEFPKFIIKLKNLSGYQKNNNFFDIFTGKTCIFSDHSFDFIKRLECDPICLEIHKIVDDYCDRNDDNPICWMNLIVTGCFCTTDSSEFYKIENSYELVDGDNNASGIIDISIKISRLGRCLQHKFQADKESLSFREINSSNVYICEKQINKEDKIKDKLWTPRMKETVNKDIEIKNIFGISMLCKDLFEKPSGPCVAVDASKNDLVSNENHEESIEHQPDVNKNLPCNTETCSRIISSDFQDIDMNLGTIKSQDNIVDRLRGGYGDKPSQFESCFCKDKPPHEYSYPGEPKKPCQGIDCLSKALKDAENFVESIGKIPGIKGLGLTDPTDSPYLSIIRRKIFTKSSPRNIALIKPDVKVPDTFIDFSSFKKNTDIDKIIEKGNNVFDEQKHVINNQQIEKINELNKKNSLNLNDTDDSLKKKKKSLKLKKKKSNKFNKHKQKFSTKIMNKSSKHPYDVKVSKRVLNLVRSVSPTGCFGHRSCVEIRYRVPRNMGWLWNTKKTPGNIKPQVDWKPGAISRRVWQIFQSKKAAKSLDDLDVRPVVLPMVKGKKNKSKSKSLLSLARNQRGRKIDEFATTPSLHIHRKKGDYYFTMYPVKKKNIDTSNQDEDVKPLQFKLTKNHDGDSDPSDQSDLEIEFSPPGALDKPSKIIEYKHADTQVTHQEIKNAFKTETLPIIKKKLKIAKKK